MLSRAKRFQIFLERLEAAPPASSDDEAFDLLAKTLNAVEDEFSGVPYRPENWQTDKRLYPPQEDRRVKCPERPSLRKYRSVAHFSFFETNGSIRIETFEGQVVIDKPGGDGRKTHDLDV
jgi:hypothetical protein